MSEPLLWPVLGSEWRGMGNRPPSISLKLGSMAALPDIPESEWKEFDLTTSPNFPIKIKDQGQFGACNGHAAATSLEVARWIAGQPHIELSPWLIYADLCRGWDTGSSIAEALQLLERSGTCESSLVPFGTINPSSVKQQARNDCKRFKIEIGTTLLTWQDLCIATQLRMPFNFSVPVNSGFNALDANGCPSNRSGQHNHAVMGGLGMRKAPDGQWLIRWQNSWGTRWGQNGRAWLCEKNIAGWGFDAYSVVATTADPTDKQPPLN